MSNLPDFSIIGICTPLDAPKLCYFINSILDIDLVKSEDLIIYSKNNGERQYFPLYEFHNETLAESYRIIRNKDNGRFCLKMWNKIDYLLWIKGLNDSASLSQVLKNIKAINTIALAVMIPIDSFDGIEYLKFE